MLAAVFNGVGDIRVERVADPRIESPTDAVVRISAAGVCGSDLWYYRGSDPIDPGARLGHEFVGVVEEIGTEVTGLRPGDRVVAPFSYSDGTCPTCRNGLPTSCSLGGFWGGDASPGGAQAEAIRVPFADANLVRLPDTGGSATDLVPYLALADVLPTALHAVTAGEVGPGSSVTIVGDGPVALATVVCALRQGAEQVLVLGHHPQRLALAEKFGATSTALSPDDAEAVTELVRRELGDRSSTAVDCVGTQSSVDSALAAVRDGGVFGYVGLPITGARVTLLDVFDRNVSIRGGVAPARRYIPELLHDVIEGRIDPSPLFERLLPLSEVQAAYAAMDQRLAVKAAVLP
ncbi:alcohol dehydrogenase catalytic domain-containing protein [Kitasatospora sp. NBC_00240]|uniref:alcohol dehydrogenase catalytic domain-containing protein n=1 Tax=Kitasatospora sp. NBC_00240 TaxID=2903567 RepID=UPI00224F82FF|nr:alcohol dehydrogenase catalytic domain-containing protein [Kitasatospora sp. NBC_00240]MCX5214522.1 alcohol dehydrogenase catalytic domain-containing protein [Kitasatospora sp. NBC_00240]